MQRSNDTPTWGHTMGGENPVRFARRAWVGGLMATLAGLLAILAAVDWQLVATSGALAIEILREVFVQYWPVILPIVAVAAVSGWLVGRRDTAKYD